VTCREFAEWFAERPCTLGCESRNERARSEGKLGTVLCYSCIARATLGDVPTVTIRIRDLADDSVHIDVVTDPPNLGEAKTPAQQIGLLAADYAMRILAGSAVDAPILWVEPTKKT
jgi:hypothetical protein